MFIFEIEGFMYLEDHVYEEKILLNYSCYGNMMEF